MANHPQVQEPAPVQPLLIDAHAPFDGVAFFKQFRHSKVQVNGINLHYVIGGQGEAVVLLNGHPQTWYYWRKIMPALAERHTVIAVDVRGTGDSDKPVTGYDAHTITQDVRQLVKQLGHERINLVAYDITGRVGYAYAAEYPDEVVCLVLMETLLPGFGLEEAMDVAKGGSYHFGFYAQVDVAESLVRGKERKHLNMLVNSVIYDHAAVTPADIDEYARCYESVGGLRGFYNHYAAFLGDSASNRGWAKRKLPMPVLALYGAALDRDTAVLPQTLTAVAENVQGEGVEGSGHFIAEERPDYLAARLLAFFGDERGNQNAP